MQVTHEYPRKSPHRIYYPEDRLPLVKLIPMGIQHVIAMFGGTVLASILMGFDPRVTLFFSGIGTLLVLFITGLRVPSYLGSSFAFIGPILAITGGNASRIPYALCGVAGAAVLYAVAAVATMRWGPSWIDRLMPPIVTGSVVAIIGLNLAGTAVFVVLVAENKGHIAAISDYMGRDLNPYLGRAYLGDALATLVSSLGGGTPQTTYAENMGVMAMTGVFSTHNFIAAAVIALLLGLCPKFGALIQAIPNPVLGGITLLLYGIIALMGIRIWMDAKVDFTRHKNLAVAGAPLIVATGLGVKGLTVAGMNIAGIALGTVLALVLNWLLSIADRE